MAEELNVGVRVTPDMSGFTQAVQKAATQQGQAHPITLPVNFSADISAIRKAAESISETLQKSIKPIEITPTIDVTKLEKYVAKLENNVSRAAKQRQGKPKNKSDQWSKEYLQNLKKIQAAEENLARAKTTSKADVYKAEIKDLEALNKKLLEAIAKEREYNSVKKQGFVRDKQREVNSGTRHGVSLASIQSDAVSNASNVLQSASRLGGYDTVLFNDVQSQLAAINKLKTTASAEQINRLNVAVQKLLDNIRAVNKEKLNPVDQTKLQKTTSEIESIGRRWSKLFSNSQLSAQYTQLRNQASSVKTEADYAKLTGDVKAFRAQVIAAGDNTKSFGDKWSEAAQKFGNWLSVSMVILGVIRVIKQMASASMELDAKVTDLQIASGKARDEVKQMVRDYADMGRELGATAIDVASAADTFLRQGKSIAEANELIRDSLYLSKLGQIEASDASTALTSAMKGYKIEAKDAISIVDKLTAIDMESASSAGGLAVAMSETANSANIAGISMDKLLGQLAVVKEVTQDADESVGNFYKTMTARMGNIKAGKLYDAANEEDLSDVEVVLSGVGIALRKQNDEFRNFGDVLDDVAASWDSYTTVQQRAIATAFAGTRQQEKFLVLMENYDTATKYAEIAANSTGNATQKYNAYLDSVQAKSESFNAQFQQLSSSVVNSELVKGTFDAGTGILWLLDQMIDKLGLIPTLSGVAGIGAFVKNISAIKNAFNSVSDSGILNNQSNLGNLAFEYATLDKVSQLALKSMISLDAQSTKQMMTWASMVKSGQLINSNLIKQKIGFDDLSEAQRASISEILKKYAVDKNGVLIEKEKIAALFADQAVTKAVGTETANKAAADVKAAVAGKEHANSIWAQVKANLALMASNPVTWIVAAVSAISLLVNAYQKYQEYIENTYRESAQAYKDAADRVQELTDKIKELNDEIDTLNGKNLTISEQSHLDTLNDELDTLNAQLQVELELEKIRKNKAYQDFNKAADRKLNTGRITSPTFDSPVVDAQKDIDELTRWKDTYQEMISQQESLLVGNISDAEKNKITDEIKTYQDRIDDLDARIEKSLQKIVSIRDYVNDLADAGDIKFTFGDNLSVAEQNANNILQYIRSLDLYITSIRSGGDASSILSTAFNLDEFKSIQSELAVTGVSVDEIVAKLQDNYGDSPFITMLSLLGITAQDVAQYLYDVANGVGAVEEATSGAGMTNLQRYLSNNDARYKANDVSDKIGTVIDEYSKSGVVSKDALNELETAIPGVTDALLNADGTWSKAGQTVLAYKDNVRAATIAVYEAVIAQQQLKLNASREEQRSGNANPEKDYAAEQSALTSSIETYQAQLASLQGTWNDAITRSVTNISSDTELLAQAMRDLTTGAFDSWDSDFVDKILSAFPNLRDELQAFADGVRDTKDLYNDMADALADTTFEDFNDALGDINDASEDFGDNSSQVQESLENLCSIVPALNGLLYDQEGNLTAVGQAALQAAGGNKEAAIAMVDAAIAAETMNLSQAISQLNNLANAGLSAAAGVAAAKAAMADSRANLATLNALKASISSAAKVGSNSSSRSGSGGGGGATKKDVLESYKNQKKILEHRVKMSEYAQDVMQEDTDAWRDEQNKQYEIYKEYAALIIEEINRLRKLGYESNSEELMSLEEDLASVRKKMYNIQKDIWQKQKDAQIKALRDQKEAAEEAHEAEMKRLDAEISRQETLIDLLETQYDLTNQLRDERYSLEKELSAANAYTNLSEAERKALFTSEDYAQLVGVLDDIQNESIVAYNQYLEKIKSVNTDEAYKLDYITSEYEAQYKLMSQKYEIAKQDLAVMRARIALENAQQNRNIAMIVDGKWTWSADPKAIEDAMDNIYDAEKEKANAQSDYIQQEKINELEMFKASIELQKEAAEAQHEKLMEQIDKLIDALEEMEFAFNDCIDGLYSAAGAISGAISAISAAASSGGGGGGGGGGGNGNGNQSATGGTVRNNSTLTEYYTGTYSSDSKISNDQRASTAAAAAKAVADSQKSISAEYKKYIAAVQAQNRVLKAAGVPGYSSGGVADYTGQAMLHGSRTSPEVIFNATDASKLYDIIHNGNPQNALFEQMVRQIRGNAPSIVSNTTTTKPTTQYIINGLTLGESAGGLTLRELANQLTSAAPLLR